ncbi:endonuclease NucS domain-containing protein [Salimicrobium flavidum]|uniref:Endonuclease NucS C-terminal domain-containing protein n=1 Tax=Salimicrobium flavidum TaxID=570947 RepID=A0A1N7KTG2_9BACI|nr:endonuclease NucS domain-containing protein [Salimicrobium flavidum]SIS64837.1 Protein of unknown function DUF91 [Salimicrobium flavidum]
MNYLIGYKDPEKNGGHEDPVLREFTYGHRKKLKQVKPGDYLFFHTMIYNKRYITAYYYVQEVTLVKDAVKDALITQKFTNHHLYDAFSEEEERIAFGNPIRSRVLEKPLEVTKELLESLENKCNINEQMTLQAAMSASLRIWKTLGKEDITLLLERIEEEEREGTLGRKLRTEEVVQVLERDIEEYISEHPEELEQGMKVLRRQYIFRNQRRLDLLMKDKDGELVVVEVKKGRIGRDAKQQIHHYMKQVKKEWDVAHVRGIIICAGVLPYFEEELVKAQKDGVFVKRYGWRMDFE